MSVLKQPIHDFFSAGTEKIRRRTRRAILGTTSQIKKI